MKLTKSKVNLETQARIRSGVVLGSRFMANLSLCVAGALAIILSKTFWMSFLLCCLFAAAWTVAQIIVDTTTQAKPRIR